MTLNALAAACAEDSLLEVTCAPPSGNLLDLTTGFNYGSGDNGNVMSWAAAGQQTFSRSYTYDGVNRLYTMSAPGSTCSGLSWSYDQWGNRTGQTVTGGTCGSSQLTFNSYNHVTNPGFQYDAAGNMTHDANHSYTYDAENRVTQVDGGATAKYAYDPLGYRVEKIAGGVTTEYVYDPEGHVAVDANWTCGQSCWSAAYFYLNGSPFAEYTSSSTEFLSGDHLGSTRLLTNVSGGVVDNMDYLPFGEQIAGASATTHKFTGYERDAESNLDNAQARYNSSSLGRFMSPDPIGNFVADATNPQSWNMYAYVDNDPTGMVDPSGLDSIRPPLPAPPITDLFDCVPLIYRRGDPWDAFDAETPYGGGFNEVPTCEGGPPRPVTGGGGSGKGAHGGRGACPLNSAGVSSCVAAPPPSHSQNPCTELQNQAQGIKTLAEGQHMIEAPFLFALPLAGSALVLQQFASLDILACTPQPGVWASCPAALLATVPCGSAIVYFDFQYIKHAGSVWKALTKPSVPDSSGCGG